MRVGGVRPIPVDVRIISAALRPCKRIPEGRFRRLVLSSRGVEVAFTFAAGTPRRHGRLSTMVLLKHASATLGSRPHPNLHEEMLRCQSIPQTYAWPAATYVNYVMRWNASLYLFRQSFASSDTRLVKESRAQN